MQADVTVTGALPRGPRRWVQSDVTGNPGGTDQAKARRVQLKKSTKPSRAKRTIASIITNRSIRVVPYFDGQPFGDAHAENFQTRGKKLSDFGSAPAVIHPVALDLRCRVAAREVELARGDLGSAQSLRPGRVGDEKDDAKGAHKSAKATLLRKQGQGHVQSPSAPMVAPSAPAPPFGLLATPANCSYG